MDADYLPELSEALWPAPAEDCPCTGRYADEELRAEPEEDLE